MKNFDLNFISQFSNKAFHIECGSVDGDFPLHTHDFCEIFLVLSGTGTHISSNVTYSIQQGDLFTIKGKEVHGFFNCKDLKLINIMFPLSLLHVQECRTMPGFWVMFLHEQSSGSISHIRLDEASFQQVFSWCQIMLDEYYADTEGSSAMCRAVLTQLIVFLSRKCQTAMQNLEQIDYRLAKALVYLETHYMESISLENLSSIAGFSVRHFCRLFQSLYNKSPMQYLLQVRIAHACNLLIETDDSITEIAQLCGFSDSNYFSKTFKSHTDFSPVQWRKHFSNRSKNI